MKMTTALSAVLGLLLATTVASAAEKFYKWTDAQGVTHYSEGPPPDSATKASAIKVQTRLPSGSAEAAGDLQKQRDKANKAAKDDKNKKDGKDTPTTDAPAAPGKAPEKYAERCKQLQGNLTTMQEHPRIKIKDEKGEERVLTAEEKSSQQDDIQREIKAYCQ